MRIDSSQASATANRDGARVKPKRPSALPWLVLIVAGVLLMVASTGALSYASRLPAGAMIASVYSASDLSGKPVLTVLDHTLDPAHCARLAGLDPGGPFSVVWQGGAVVTEQGVHHVRARVDDGVSVWLDDRRILEETRPGRHDISAPVDLAPGLHRLRVRYVQLGGDMDFRFTWARPSWREDFVRVSVVPPYDQLSFAGVSTALQIPTVVATAWSIWILAAVGITFYRALWRLTDGDAGAVLGSWHYVTLAVAALLLLGVGIEVGVEPWRGWAADEVSPKRFVHAANEWFANGWFFLYPPFHVYLLNLVTSPFHILAQSNWLSLGDYDTQALMHVLGRGLSVLMGLLTLLVTGLIAHSVVGKRAAILAPVLLMSVPSFVFYSKTANVDLPYLLWVAVAMLFFVRAIETRAVGDYAVLGAAVALAVATKDQAYGFFPGAALVLLWWSWRQTPADTTWRYRALATLGDRRLWAGCAVCLAVYVVAIGLLWNPQGVVGHFQLITGGVAEHFRMFPRTLAGTRDLARATLLLVPPTLGPICTIFSLAGLAVAVFNARSFRHLLLLLSMVASYVVCFILVAGYVYDRFLLGIALVAAVFGAVGLESILGAIRNQLARRLLLTCILLVAAVPSLMLNWRIVSDSRRQVEQWMAVNLRDDPFVVAPSRQHSLPNLRPFRHVLEERGSKRLIAWNADVIVLNEQWLDRSLSETAPDIIRALKAAGYQEVFAVRQNEERSWAEVLLTFDVSRNPEYSNLHKVSPPISVWRRPPAAQERANAAPTAP